jgi:hypothetical protein
MRKRTRKRPPPRGSVSATSTGPSSGPHQQAMPSGVVPPPARGRRRGPTSRRCLPVW